MRKINVKLKNPSEAKKLRRRLSIRKKISGSGDRPRVCVKRSDKNISVQVVDDNSMKTIFSVSTYGKNKVEAKANKEGAKSVGAKVAEELKNRNIETIVFDRSGYIYHGVIASLADSIRENGIKF